MLGPKGVITVEGSFKQAYYCEQDCIAQATALIAPCDPNSSGHDAGRAPVEEAAKAAAALDRPSIGEADKVTSGSGGMARPSIQMLGPQKGLTQSRRVLTFPYEGMPTPSHPPRSIIS
jgi:hypothetical protein